MENNIIPHLHKISKQNRRILIGQHSLVIWFTGLSGSGKSTLAGKLEETLFKNGIGTYILDGDNVRMGLNKDLSFSENDRKENIRRISEVSKLFVDAGIVVITAFISPYKADRDMIRDILDEKEFIEIFVKCPLEICEQRDVKGLYKKARNGEVRNFTGINSIYEEPIKPDLVIETHSMQIEECVKQIYNYVFPLIKQGK
jgi:adenylylsulfate kinase